MQEGSLFSIPSLAFVLCVLINDGHSDRCEFVPNSSLIFISLLISDAEDFFPVLFNHLYIFLGEISIQFLCPLFHCVVCFSAVELYKLFVYFRD